MRFHRLLGVAAVVLAGMTGPLLAAGENVSGKWSNVITLPLVPASGALLPDGKLLLWAADGEFGFGSGGNVKTVIFDPVALTSTAKNFTTGHNMFCTGTTLLADGRVLMNGGSQAPKTSIFDPKNSSLTAVQDMQIPRGYNANTILSDGSVFTLGGSWSGSGEKKGEIWTASGGWRTLSGVSTANMLTPQSGFPSDSHYWLIPGGNGKVLRAGPSTAMQWINTSGNGSVTSAGQRGDDVTSISAGVVMYDTGRILKAGGSEIYSDSSPANAKAYTIDIRRGVSVTKLNPMAYARGYHNAVVLPDGKVAQVGGQSVVAGFSNNDAVLPIELWNPVTGAFQTGAAMSVARNYHSIALLLPDARVLSAGGGLCGDGCSGNHPDLQIYSPPYLFDAAGNLRPRPVITNVPTELTYGGTAAVTTDKAVTSFSLIRVNSTTHTVNNDQRRLSLTFSQTGTNSYAVNIPSNAGYLLPGYWMLFAMDADGTPSVSKMVHVSPNAVATLIAPDAIATSVGKSVNAAATITPIGSSITYGGTNLPSGVSVNPTTGAITGTPTASGTYYASLTASTAGQTVSTDFVIAVDPAPGNGSGLRGDYFNNLTLSGSPVLTRTERPDFDFAANPPGGGVNATNYSVRWSGTLLALRTGATRFQTLADDGIRLWVNGKLLVDNWNDHPTATNEGSVDLIAGQSYQVMIDYYQGGGGAEMRFKWQQPGDSGFALVPPSQLFPAAALPTTNLALNKTASQSSLFEQAPAPRAVDGNTNGAYGSNSVTHTQNGANEWWQVDLGSNYALNLVRLWNRTDCCTDRLQNFEVLISTTDMTGRSYASLIADTAITRRSVGATQIPTTIGIPVNATGRYIRVIFTGSQFLHLAEVEAFGSSINRAPTVTDLSAQFGNVGAAVDLAVNATDPDGDVLSYSATGLPAGVSINSTTGKISGSLTTGGSYSTTVTAKDPGGLSDATSFAWTVTVNLPSVTSLPVSTALVGQTVTYTPVIANSTGATFSWNFGDSSAVTDFSSTAGTTHAFAKAGVYTVTLTLQASDGRQTTYRFDQSVQASQTSSAKVVANAGLAVETRSGGNRLWVVNPDNDSVAVIDLKTNTRVTEIPTGDHPTSVAIDKNGLVWVVNRDSATIKIIDPATLAITRTVALPYGSRPTSLIFAGAAGNGIVTLEAYGDLVAISLNANTLVGDVIGSANVGSSPRFLAYAESVDRLLVPRFITPPLPGESTGNVATKDANGNPVGAEVVAVWMTGIVDRTVVLQHSDAPDTESSARGIPNYLGAPAIAPDGLSAWIPSKQDNIKRGVFRDGNNLNFQNTVRAIVSKIDLTTGLEVLSARVDLDNSGVASAALFHPSGAYLFVALQSSRQVAVVDPVASRELFRFKVGRAPSTLALSPDGNTLYVGNFMDRTVSVVDLAPLLTGGQKSVTIVADVPTVATEKLSATVLKGKQLFYDAADTRLARDGYLSCAACHDDGDSDGRVWDITGFGEGLRNTISLKGHGGMSQGFLHWSANFDEVQDFEGQIRTLAGGTGLMTDTDFNSGTRSKPLGDAKAGLSADLDALAAYAASLTVAPPSPYRVGGAMTAAGLAGKDVFTSLGCDNCHTGTDLTISGDATKVKNVGTINAATGKRLDGSITGIDVPTLLGIWQTGPYLHNGSALTIPEAVRSHSGVTVSDADMAKLMDYLVQLGPTP